MKQATKVYRSIQNVNAPY